MHAASDANGPEGGTDWQSVNWRKAQRAVRNLRQRIFRASQHGDMRTVHALQKLMLRSYSNTLLSVRRVTQQNAGRYTPGVDKVVIKTSAARGRLVDLLSTAQPWRAHPARRVYIPKYSPTEVGYEIGGTSACMLHSSHSRVEGGSDAGTPIPVEGRD